MLIIKSSPSLFCSQIDVAPVGMSKGVRKLLQAKVPNMAKFDDVSEYIERYSRFISEQAIWVLRPWEFGY